MPTSRRKFLAGMLGTGAAAAGTAILPAPAFATSRAAIATTTTAFGVDVNKVQWPITDLHAILEQDLQAYGVAEFGHCKTFGSDWSDALNGLQAMYAGGTPGPFPLLCARAHTDASLNAALDYFGQLGMQWGAIFFQEVQPFILRGDLRPATDQYYPNVPITSANFCATVKQMHKLKLAHPHGDLMRIVICSAGYTLFSKPTECQAAGCDAVSLASNAPCWAVTVDHYWPAPLGTAYEAEYLNRMKLFAGWGKQVRKYYALTEFGLGVGLPNRPKLLQTVVNQARTLGFAWANYWEGGQQASTNDFSLRNDPASLAVMHKALTSS